MTQRVPTSEAFALRSAVSKQILLLLGVLVGALGVVGLTVGRNTVRSVTDLATRAEALQEGDLETTISSPRSDEFGTVYAALDQMRRSLQSEIEEARTAREQADEARREAERQREESEVFTAHLEATAQEYAETMRACAEGDLTRRLPTDSDSEAMTTVATSFNAVLDSWERTIDDVRAVSREVSAESDETATDVTAARETSETLATSMESIAGNATEQARNLQGVNEEMEALSASIEEVSATANEVTRRADRALAEGETGREAASAAADELDAIESHTEQAVEQVESLDSLMSDIEDIVTTIDTIADQTDMLAVNASIEAANASGESDGFAVVAEEVKSLAEQTQEATAEIAATVEQVRGQTTATVEEIQQTRTRVQEGAETIEDALSALDTVVDEVEGTTAGVREINSGIQNQAESTQEVVTMVGDVTAVSETTATEAETRATEASEQSETMADIAASVDRFADRARQLQERLEAFETSGTESRDRSASAPADASDRPVRHSETAGDSPDEPDEWMLPVRATPPSDATESASQSDGRLVGDGSGDD